MSCKLKIGIDASYIMKKFDGGKEQVLMNILKGFGEKGLSPVVFCNEVAVKKIASVCPSAEFEIIDFHTKLKMKIMIKNIFIRTFVLPRMVNGKSLDILLFPMPNTGFAKFKCKTVVIPHDVQFKSNPYMYQGWKYRVIGWIYGNDFSKRDAIVAISEFDKDEIEKYFAKYADKVVKIYNPIDFGEVEKKSIQNERPYIFSNNLMHPHKNLDVLLEAFATISEKGWEGKLVISGLIYCRNEECHRNLKKMVESGLVELTGYVTDKRMKELIEGAKFFVNPSSFEGFGMSAVEAMGNEIACVLADNSAVKEVTLGRAKYYRPARDSKALASEMRNMLDNPMAKDQLKQTAEIIRNRYDYRRIVEEYLDLFKKIGVDNE